MKKILFILFILFYNMTYSQVKSLEYNNIEIDSIRKVYLKIDIDTLKLPRYELFKTAYNGYLKLEKKGIIKNKKLTIVDFSISSKKKRLWVFDIKNNKLLYHTLVAHGINSGCEFASKFSNKIGSKKSSLGFYLTDNTYYGSNGLALNIDGMDYGKNNNIRVRKIVIHSANYVSQKEINRLGFLGRSEGCLALNKEISNKIILTIKNKSCIYVSN